MSEVEAVVAADPVPEKKKRSRSKQNKSPKGGGVVILGERFVCNLSGRIVSRVVLIPGVADAVFANVPCAVAWINQNYAHAPEKQEELKASLCAEYEQDPSLLVPAPDRSLLVDFGGSQTYEQWIGPLHFWDRLTEASGCTVQQYKASLKGGVSKRGKKNETRLPFDAAMYVISHGKGASGCKVVDSHDGAEEDADADPAPIDGDKKKKRKSSLTPVKAMRKLSSFVHAHPLDDKVDKKLQQPAYKTVFRQLDGATVIALQHVHGADDKEVANVIASQLLGEKVYGPAVAIFTRKTIVKL